MLFFNANGMLDVSANNGLNTVSLCKRWHARKVKKGKNE